MAAGFDDGNATDGLVQAIDWAATPLGPMEGWSPSLRTAVSLCLNAPFPLLMGWGPELVLISNAAFDKLFGKAQPASHIGQRGQAGWPAIWQSIGPRLAEVLATGSPAQFDSQITLNRHGYPASYSFTFSVSPIWGERASVGGVLCAVTETMQAEQVREQIEQILEGIKDDFVMYDDEWRYVYVNHAAAQSLGYPKEQLIGQRIWDLFPGAVGNQFYQYMMQAKANKSELVFEHYYAPWGKWIENRAYPLDDGMLLFAADITERKRVEEALRESEARFRHMADHAPVMVWVTEPDGRCTYLSKSWLLFTGQTIEDGMGYGWIEAVHPDDRAATKQAFMDANVRQEAFGLEYNLRRSDGLYRWVLDAAAPRFSEGGVFMGYIGSVIDITERRQVELERAQLYAAEQAARLAAERSAQQRDELLAYIAHDLKNPLTALLATTQLIQRRMRATSAIDVERLQRGLRTIEMTAAQLAAQLNELQDIAHLQAGQPLDLQLRTTDLVALVERAVTTCQAATELHQIHNMTALSELGCICDPFRIERVITNVLANAVKYSPQGGAITVMLSSEINTADSWACITVADTGIGISASDLPHIFERFYRGQNVAGQSGTGLGLASTQAIVVHHGGQVSVASVLGQGTTVTIRLPLTPATAPLATHEVGGDSADALE